MQVWTEGGGFQRISEALDRFFLWLEKDRFPIIGLFLYVLAIATIRDISEYFLLDAAFVTTPHPWVFSIAHHVAFYLVTFLGLVLLLSAFSGRGLRRSTNYLCTFFWIVILPPYLDHFLFGLDQNYSYSSATDFLNALVHFSGASFNPGQAIEIGMVLFGMVAYVSWLQRGNLDTPAGRLLAGLRIGSLVLFAFTSMFVLATPGAYLPVGSTGGYPDFPNFETTRYHQLHLFMLAYYVLVGLLLLVMIAQVASKGKLGTYLRSVRPFQTFFFLIIVAAGMSLGWTASGGGAMVTSLLDTPYWVNISFLALGLTSAALVWIASAMWNDISDRHIDGPFSKKRVLSEGLMGHHSYAQISLTLVISALIIAALLSYQSLLLLSMVILLSYAYSFPPLRLKEHSLRPLMMGMGTFLAFIYGFVTPYSEVGSFPARDIYYLTAAVISPTLTLDAFYIGATIGLGIVVGSMVTDIDGVEEDRRGGIRTIYTVLGLERGTLVVSALVFFAALTPLLLFNESEVDLALFPLLGATAAFGFFRSRKARVVMLVATAGLIYAAFRFLP